MSAFDRCWLYCGKSFGKKCEFTLFHQWVLIFLYQNGKKGSKKK